MSNPVQEVIKQVAENPNEFTAAEIGVTNEELKEAIEAVFNHLMEDAIKMHGMPAIQQEDLAYLFLLGLCSGYELHKSQTQGENEQ